MKRVMMICLAVCIGAAASAQRPGAVTLTLDEAVRIALDENLTIRIADLEIERFDYVRRETIGGLYPGVSVSGGYSRAIVEQKLGGSISFGGKNTFSGSADLALPLFAPGIYATLRLNREQMLAAVESARSSRVTLVSEVRKAYYNILLAEQSLTVLRASEKTVGETVENTRVMFQNGLAAEYDLITAEVQLSNLQPTIIHTQHSIEVAKMLLRMYLSLPQDVQIAVSGTLDDFRDQILAASDMLSTDLSQNCNLRALEIQERILDRSLRATRTQRYPVLGAYGSFQIIGQDLNLGALSSMMGGPEGPPSRYRYNWQHPASVGVQLSVPIFAGFSRVNRERQLKNSMQQLSLQRTYVEQGLAVEVRSSINGLITAREKMRANEKTVAQAQKAHSISKTRFQAGAGTILELNSSELNLTQAKLNYSQSMYDFLSAQADYERIIGRE